MFYNKYFKSNYEELLTYYPRYYRDVLEMQAILVAEGKLADGLENGIERVFADCFIDSSDLYTVQRLEAFLGIDAPSERSLEERRQFIKSHFMGIGRTSASVLADMIRSYTGGDVDITFKPFDVAGNNCLFIDLPYSQGTLYANDIEKILIKRLPAHVMYRIRLKMDLSTGLYPVSSLFPSHEIYPKQ